MTDQQRKALHLYFTQLAEAFNEAGYNMKVATDILAKEDIDIPWTKENVKNLWKFMQDAMLEKKSTTELDIDEISIVYETFNQLTAEKFGISILFPSIETQLFERRINDEQ